MMIGSKIKILINFAILMHILTEIKLKIVHDYFKPNIFSSYNLYNIGFLRYLCLIPSLFFSQQLINDEIYIYIYI